MRLGLIFADLIEFVAVIVEPSRGNLVQKWQDKWVQYVTGKDGLLRLFVNQRTSLSRKAGRQTLIHFLSSISFSFTLRALFKETVTDEIKWKCEENSN